MNIPEFLKKLGETPDAIYKTKTNGEKQRRDFTSSESPAVVTMSIDDCKAKCKAIGVEYKSGYEGRVLSYTCSDASVDRMGDVIKQEGWDTDNFKKNPVIMANHNYGEYPIGNALSVKVVNEKLKMEILFADKDVSEDADKAFKLAKTGFMKAGSVGFIPKEHHRPTPEDCDTYGMEKDGYGVVFDKQELLEFSVCGVPANANAIQESIGKGIVSKSDFKKFLSEDEYNKLEEKEITADDLLKPAFENSIPKGLTTDDVKNIIKGMLPEEKQGATLSKKTKKLIAEAVNNLKVASESLVALLGIEEEPEKEPEKSVKDKTESEDSQSFEFNLDDIEELPDGNGLYTDETFEITID